MNHIARFRASGAFFAKCASVPRIGLGQSLALGGVALLVVVVSAAFFAQRISY
jgi:hypothetical protein